MKQSNQSLKYWANAAKFILKLQMFYTDQKYLYNSVNAIEYVHKGHCSYTETISCDNINIFSVDSKKYII